VVGRDVQRFEVVVVILDLRALYYLVSHADEDALDFIESDAVRMAVTHALGLRGERYVDDLSLELGKNDLFSSLRETWEGIADELLRSTKIVDTYDTEFIHSITVRFEFGSNERTLSSAEVQEAMDEIIKNLGDIGVTLRK
jgi:hypothetical protein